MPNRQILVPLDGSILAECVLPHVIALGQVFDSKIILMRVITSTVNDSQLIDPLSWEMKKAEAVSYLQQKKEQLEQVFDTVESHLFEGKAAEKIIEFARQENVDLIALSSHGQSGINEWNISSVVQKIILQSQKSILLIRAYQAMSAGIHEVAYQKLAIPLDCSQRAELTLPLAVNIAKFFNAEIILAHVTREPELICRHPPSEEELNMVRQLTECNRNYVEKYFEQLTTQLTSQGVAVQSCLQTSKNVSEAMHALVEEQKIDLMLMTAHGATGSHKWPYGNMSTSFIIYGSTPIIIIQDLKPGEFEASLAEVVAREYKGH